MVQPITPIVRFLAIVMMLVLLTALVHNLWAFTSADSPNEPILIAGVQEPEEMLVKPFPLASPSAPELMLLDEIQKRKGSAAPSDALPALDRVLASYPEYSEGYFLRVALLCQGGDQEKISYAVKTALDHAKNTSGEQRVKLLSMEAKLKYNRGDYASAIKDLEQAIHADLDSAVTLANSGAIAPEDSAPACTWTRPEVDSLAKRFPTDYRTYLVRGLYYAFFAQFDESSRNLSIQNFLKANELNSRTPLPRFFIAQMLSRAFAIKKLGMSETERTQLNQRVLKNLNSSLLRDPNLLPTVKERAEVYFQLKQFRQAVTDYDKVLVLDPSDAGAYNDRGLAKMQLGRPYEAISDFGNAIKRKKRELLQSSSYENRAEAYLLTQQWKLAIRDLSTAISLDIGGLVQLSNIQHFRSIYTEYASVPDEVIAHKLHSTFHPDLDYEAFSKRFLRENEPFRSSVLVDLYLKRSDAYLKAGDWHNAAVDFRRAINGFPEYGASTDRWRQISSGRDRKILIDIRTLDGTQGGSGKVWLKQAQVSEEATVSYSLQQYEINCSAREIRTLSSADYDKSGKLIGGADIGYWQSVVPDTVGELVLEGMCRTGV